MTVLRRGLLEGRTVAVAGPLRPAVAECLTELGAEVAPLAEGLDDEAAERWADEHAPLHAVVYDTAPVFSEGGRDGLMATLETVWPAIRAVAARAMIPAGAGGRIVLIAPAADAPIPHIEAARAALENIARTLSIEWARHAIATTMIAPGGAGDADLATLVSFLVSSAGAYYSGCRFELS
jgi:NAD(P)-dependent dehydrogenase (short-subunit alcohol dehydrogenase family)